MDVVNLEKALAKKCKSFAWLAWILFLTATPVMFNSANLASYVFLGGEPSFFCNVPELVEANWTIEQIRMISSPGLEKESCVQYAWNYSLLRELDFDDALNYINLREKPDLIKCNGYIYEEDTKHKTIVSEWDLVCDNSPLTVQTTVAIGKCIGAIFFGMISDMFGRKKTFIFSAVLYMVAGPSAAFVKSYFLFVALRVMIGLAGAGVYDTSYAILMELTVKKYKAYVGNIFHISFSLGIMLLPVAASLTHNWRQLQLALSAPMIILVIQFWFLPESPSWLISSGNTKKAANIIGAIYQTVATNPQKTDKEEPDEKPENVLFLIRDYIKLFSTLELFKRILISYYLWCLGNFYYYVIALNGLTFDVNQYLYMGLNGMIEMPGVLLSLLFVTCFGRKRAGMVFWIISGIAMLLLLVAPQGWPIISVTMAGRFAGVAANGIVMSQTIDLFPKEYQNTAMGSCVKVAQLGSLLAPYIVEAVGEKLWWFPTTLCGFFALFGAFLLQFVPETKPPPVIGNLLEMKTLKNEVKQRIRKELEERI